MPKDEPMRVCPECKSRKLDVVGEIDDMLEHLLDEKRRIIGDSFLRCSACECQFYIVVSDDGQLVRKIVEHGIMTNEEALNYLEDNFKH